MLAIAEVPAGVGHDDQERPVVDVQVFLTCCGRVSFAHILTFLLSVSYCVCQINYHQRVPVKMHRRK